MRILESRQYVGPNQYAYFPVIRLTVDLGELEEWPTGRLGAGFVDGLLDALPGLETHRCSWGVERGFFRRMTEEEGTWLGHVLEHVAIEIQCAAGSSVRFGRARSAGRNGVYHVIFEYRDSVIGTRAGALALSLLHSLLPPVLRPPGEPAADFDFHHEMAQLAGLAAGKAFGPSTAALVRSAEARKIPWFRLDDGFMLQLGYGSCQRRVQGAITSETPHLAVELASDKPLTSRTLGGLGLPVPDHVVVRSEEEALAAAERLGYPVVLKPVDGNHGRGVTPGVSGPDEVVPAFRRAREQCAAVMVEEHVSGNDYRLLVVGEEVVAAARRIPGRIEGDGVSTVAELVCRVNLDPLRSSGHENLLTRLELDEQADRMLAKQGLTRGSVPPAGGIVYLRATANLSTGGTAIDVTDLVHADNRILAHRAARAIGLDIAGVDFITPDISRSHHEVGGAICEVNAAPGLRMHLGPQEGQARDVAGPILDRLFPSGSRGTIPIVAITGTNGKTTTAWLVAHILETEGRRVGLTTTEGIFIGGHTVMRGDMSGPESALKILRDPSVDVAVLETARGGLLRAGLAFRHCEVGAVLNVTGDHLGLGGIETVEAMAELKRIVIEVARGTAVLNADDPLCVGMAAHTPAQTVCYFGLDGRNDHIARHVARGGRAVVLDPSAGGTVVLHDGAERIPLLPVVAIPVTLQGRAVFNAYNAMAATAIAWALGSDIAAIRKGLESFGAGPRESLGRLMVCDGLPFRVILDYGHNTAAVRAVCATLDRVACDGRRICVVAAPGDRRDEDIREVARAIVGYFDCYICRRDDSLRGRGPVDVPELLRDALIQSGVRSSAVSVVPAEAEAVCAGLRMAKPGDTLVLFYDNFERTRDQVRSFQPEGTTRARPALTLPARPGSKAERGCRPGDGPRRRAAVGAGRP